MKRKKIKQLGSSLLIVALLIGFSSFVSGDEAGKYGSCDKSNSNPCKITKSDGTVVLNSTGAWIAP